jgi:murein DD-endopeptidase MepM/ murein hydrolase activator NlpD
LTAHSRYPQATSSPRLVAERLARQSGNDLRAVGAFLAVGAGALFGHTIPAFASAAVGPRGLRFVLNVATALLVLSLPYSVAGGFARTSATEPVAPAASVAGISEEPAARASSSARGLLAGSRSIVTVASEDVRPVVEYKVKKSDNLGSISKEYGVEVDDLAYANGINQESNSLRVDQTLLIPPGRGALYFVKEGDTYASVATKFKVEPAVIMNYNRLYFEPEHFATNQLIFVPGAQVPALKRTEFAAIPMPTMGYVPTNTGRLSLPVSGVFTQYYWWGHSGVDIAAPYGTGIGAAEDGVVSATGWVAVGGLRVCIDHSGGLQTCYYHTGSVYVTPGQSVARGQLVAAIGMTGVTTGPHVHWEVKLNGVAVNPLAY